MSDYPREITLKDETTATISRTHVAVIKQPSGTVVLDAECLMQLLLAMKENSEPLKVDFE